MEKLFYQIKELQRNPATHLSLVLIILQVTDWSLNPSSPDLFEKLIAIFFTLHSFHLLIMTLQPCLSKSLSSILFGASAIVFFCIAIFTATVHYKHA